MRTEWGWGLFKKQTVVGVVAIRFNSKGGGGVALTVVGEVNMFLNLLTLK